MSNLLDLNDEPPAISIPTPDPEWPVKIKRGANWFYWIAGLSAVNSAAFLMNANFHFLTGLGLTEISDALIQASINEGAPPATKIVSVVFDLIVFIGFALFGYFGGKGATIAFVLGIIVYVLDVIIVVLLGEYLMAGFHIFVLFGIFGGFKACRDANAFYRANPAPLMPPPPPSEVPMS